MECRLPGRNLSKICRAGRHKPLFGRFADDAGGGLEGHPLGLFASHNPETIIGAFHHPGLIVLTWRTLERAAPRLVSAPPALTGLIVRLPLSETISGPPQEPPSAIRARERGLPLPHMLSARNGLLPAQVHRSIAGGVQIAGLRQTAICLADNDAGGDAGRRDQSRRYHAQACATKHYLAGSRISTRETWITPAGVWKAIRSVCWPPIIRKR